MVLKIRLRRECKRCGEMFAPIGKYSRVCEPCKLKAIEKVKKMWHTKHYKEKWTKLRYSLTP